MTESTWQTEQFQRHRPQLRAVAYRMLGSVSEADDAVQEAWLRLNRSDAAAIDNLAGWLTTVVGRVCIDMLRARQARREEQLGPQLPEPIVHGAEGTDPENEALVADTVGIALLVVLDTLSPAERLAFVLHDLFAMPFDEIASIVERSPEAARQLASRARRRVRGATPAPDADPGASEKSWPRFSRPREPAISMRCSRCSTRRRVPRRRRRTDPPRPAGRSAVPARSRPTAPPRARASRPCAIRRSSTAAPGS